MNRTASHIGVPLVAAALAAAMIAGAPVCAPAQTLEKRIDDKEKELGRIKKEIDDHRKSSRELKKQEATVMKRLSNLDKEIDLSRRFLRNLEEQEALLGAQIDSLQSEIGADEALIAMRREALARRVRQMYTRDPRFRWEVLLGSSNIEQALTRYRFMQIIAEQDAAMIADYHGRKRVLEVESARMTESLSDLVVLRQEREEEAHKLEANKKERESTLAQIRGKKGQHNKAIATLEKSQKEVQDLITRLERERTEEERRALEGLGNFAVLKGRLPWPVEGKVIRKFGKITHPKYATVTFNNGIDIAAASGTPILAVSAGVVEFVDWIDAYGKCIILNHGGGYYTLYAHVAATFVAQGQSVQSREVIAEVGDTGSLEGFVCHFEVRQSKRALNPLEWLAPSRAGGASR
jgi:septal ring factor EnvC (AmiA/AmiB activator)